MAPPRWLADEMVGRLARYLRIQGCDTRYVRGLSDGAILEIAIAEHRILLTRDRALARRTDRVLLLTSPTLRDQWRSVARAFPDLPREVAFTRCTACNEPLVPYVRGVAESRQPGIPWHRVDAGLPLFRCTGCDHLYWEGSHTARVREQIRTWAEEP